MDVTGLIRPKTLSGANRAIWTKFVSVTGTRPISRALVAISVGATLVATMMIIVLHLLPDEGGVNPLHGMLSDYALQPDGWVFRLALVVMGIGSVPLWAVLVRHHVLRGWLPMVFMAVWCVGLIGIAIFSKDRVETNQTIHGGVHLWVTVAACGALPLVGLALGLRHRKHQSWRRYARSSLCLAVANIPCLLPFVIAFFLNVITHSERFSGPATGLIERIMAMLDIVSLIVLGIWAYAAAHNRAAVLVAKRQRKQA